MWGLDIRRVYPSRTRIFWSGLEIWKLEFRKFDFRKIDLWKVEFWGLPFIDHFLDGTRNASRERKPK